MYGNLEMFQSSCLLISTCLYTKKPDDVTIIKSYLILNQNILANKIYFLFLYNKNTKMI